MPYIFVENLSAGVDRRRPIYASQQGSIWQGINGHLSRGGDFEKRKAFEATFDVTGLSTFGLQNVATDIYVFGSVTTPVGLPVGLNYQRLQHPDGLAMTKVLWSTLFDGKIYVVAQFSGGDILHFYDGAIINDWIAGKVRSAMTDNDGIAEHLKTLIDEDNTYTVTRTLDTLDITATVAGVPFTISKATEDGGGTDDQDIILTETQANISGGSEVLATGSFKITGGTNNPAVNQVTSVKVDGVEIMNVAQDWATSNSATATAIASQINTFNSTPEYTATASGSTVTISAATGSGDGPNGFVVEVTVAGDVTVANINDMSGGVDGTSNQAQKYDAEVDGTFEVGDLFTIIIDDKVFGHQGNPDNIAETVLTHEGKVYAPAGSLLQFSAVNNAAAWNADTDIGAGAINMSNQDEGSANLTALAQYQGNLAVFSIKTIQIWFVEADDDNNLQLQTLRRTGTRSPGSVQSFGDTDVFYLDSVGVRSLRARDSSNNAQVNDVGTLIDSLVQTWVGGLTATQIKDIKSIIEPEDGRYWLGIDDKILVFSYFPGSKISGWSWYEPGFNPQFFTDSGDNTGPYVRDDADMIYKYGGSDNATYDTSLVTCWLPFMDGGKPGHFKEWESIDIEAENTWDCVFLNEPTALAKEIQVGQLAGFTLLEDHVQTLGHYPMISPKLTCNQAGYASISAIILHYNLTDAETP